jgi:hypothetical protein
MCASVGMSSIWSLPQKSKRRRSARPSETEYGGVLVRQARTHRPGRGQCRPGIEVGVAHRGQLAATVGEKALAHRARPGQMAQDAHGRFGFPQQAHAGSEIVAVDHACGPPGVT